MKHKVKHDVTRHAGSVRISFDGRSGSEYRMSGEALLLQNDRSGPLGSIVLCIGALVGL